MAGFLRGQGVRCYADRKQHSQQAEVHHEDEDEQNVAGVRLLICMLCPASHPTPPTLAPVALALLPDIIAAAIISAAAITLHNNQCGFLVAAVNTLHNNQYGGVVAAIKYPAQ